MTTITTRSGKGSPLTNNEVDANFTNLNTDKAELSGATFTGAVTMAGAATFNSSVTIPSDIIHAGDTDTKLQFNAADSFRVITGDEERIKANNGEVVVNDNGADMDFRVESDGNDHMLFVDGGNNRVGIGTGSPDHALVVRRTDGDSKVLELSTGDSTATMNFSRDGNPTAFIKMFEDGSTGTGALIFGTGSSASPTERFRIASDGSLSTPTAGTSNVRFGVNAGNSIASGGNYNTVVGDEAGTAITTGDLNTAVGSLALDANITGNDNTSLGSLSLSTNTGSNRNTAIGSATLQTFNVTSDTHTYNTAVGYSAGNLLTTGVFNTLIGGLAGDALNVGQENVALGQAALSDDTKGSKSTAIGQAALSSQNFTSATDSNNTALGYFAGLSVTTGTSNTFVGALAGDAITTGTENTLIGHNATASAVNAAYQTVLGSGVVCVGNSNFTFGNGTNDSNIAFGATSITAPSDSRLKEEIETSTAGLSFINDLRPVTYKWKKEKDIPEALDAYVEGSENRLINNTTNHGFIAQEVKAAIDNHSEIKNGFDMWMEKESDGQQRIAPSALVPILVKAIQEQQALIESLEARLSALEE